MMKRVQEALLKKLESVRILDVLEDGDGDGDGNGDGNGHENRHENREGLEFAQPSGTL